MKPSCLPFPSQPKPLNLRLKQWLPKQLGSSILPSADPLSPHHQKKIIDLVILLLQTLIWLPIGIRCRFLPRPIGSPLGVSITSLLRALPCCAWVPMLSHPILFLSRNPSLTALPDTACLVGALSHKLVKQLTGQLKGTKDLFWLTVSEI